MDTTFFQEISDDDLIYGRFEILITDNGFMPYDHDCDEYLYDNEKNNCFDNYFEAEKLINDFILTLENDL